MPLTRRKLNLSDKLAIAIRQALCPLCNEPLGDLNGVEFDHTQALCRGGSDTNDNLRAVHADCHKVKTNGTKASKLGADKFEGAKTKRLVREQTDFRAKLLARECGEKREAKGKIKSRGFQKRKGKAA
ncbi:HNH endonuclease signature motif containing protein [Flexibacterium corallicola]|uniref:HNH endonuclease signature motif containing protein n=1 Tax=Flexibacterium corallicola TaxID=3037259 RepID=UPI00286F36DE|nr:HNH endonuclease signature motif containing protein [Pseudovibrio sp. M1P-2-3]